MSKQKDKSKTKTTNKNKFPRHCYMNGNGNWIVDFTFRGVRYKENLGPVSRSVAKETAARRRSAAAEGRLEPASARIDDQPFDKVCDKYLEWCAGHLRPRSHERAVTSSLALKAYFSGRHLSKISAFNIEAYKLDRKTACDCATAEKATKPSQRCTVCNHFLLPKSNATVNRELAMLKALFNKAAEWKFVKESPMKRIKFFPEGKGRTRFLTEAEAKKLLECCSPDFRDVVLMALHSGCRKPRRSRRMTH